MVASDVDMVMVQERGEPTRQRQFTGRHKLSSSYACFQTTMSPLEFRWGIISTGYIASRFVSVRLHDIQSGLTLIIRQDLLIDPTT